MQDKQYISTVEAAKLLGVSRITVFNRIKKGQLTAKKVGRNFIIDTASLPTGKVLTEAEKATIKQAVSKTVRDYGETLKLLEHA